MPLSNSEKPTEKDFEIDSKLWARFALPNTVAPTFDTCNLSRHYELEIKIGLGYGSLDKIKVNTSGNGFEIS